MRTFDDYRRAFAKGTTPADVVREVFARIRTLNDPAVFIALRPEVDLIAEAEALAKRSSDNLPLFGLPVAVKDNIDVAGLPTTAACEAFTYTPEKDAFAVARLRAAGALIIGKTNLDQFATGLVGVRSTYGVPRNVLDANLVPGGSSSGSAIAVAAGIVPFALGTDTAGSGRVPAGLNNIVGLKPSLGAVSSRGMVPACRTLDTISVFAHVTEDAWDAYSVIAAYDAEDSFSRKFDLGRPGAAPPALRLGVPDVKSLRFGGDALSAKAFEAMIAKAHDNGATIVPVDLTPFYATAALLYDGPWVAERYQAIRGFMEKHPDALHPVTRKIINVATKFSAADAFGGLYKLAELKRATQPVWSDIDAMLVPTFPRPRTRADLDADPIGPNAELGTYTNFVNLLDLAAFAVPGVPRDDGWPAGVTLIGPAGSDAMLASIGSSLHHGRDAPSFNGASGGSNGIELAVVGAHLSGLPLNHELTSLGARHLRTVATRPDYELFALNGGPPHRPGLLRIADGAGHAIETEVWSLTPEAFGKFVSGVPAPLSIGTLRLADGTQPKGFIVEAEGVNGASNISEYGGWRAYSKRSG